MPVEKSGAKFFVRPLYLKKNETKKLNNAMIEETTENFGEANTEKLLTSTMSV